MGVKGLWTLLSPICDKKTLWELQGQTVAIDLSCWICDSQTISFAVTRPHLRNLFFRTSCLLLAGIRPVFVLEGDAPKIKQKEMRRRIQNVWNREEVEVNSKIKESRPRLRSIIQQCCKLLEALGVSSVQSPGEGEAMCAHLNAVGLVDGCITQDNDCFLYGANTVYRNFSSSRSSKGGGFSVDAYDMAVVQRVLGLDREALVAIALLCGCDYEGEESDGRGVAGIGIETAAQLMSSICTSSNSVIARMKSWVNDPYFSKLEKDASEIESGSNCLHCGHRGNLGRHDRVGCKSCERDKGCLVKCNFSKENSLLNMPLEERKSLMLEVGIRRKALVNPKFPSKSIVDEYLSPLKTSHSKSFIVSWSQPNLQKFLDFSVKYLGWAEDYSLEKFLPLLTRWKILHGKSSSEVNDVHIVSPICIRKQRASRGICYYEVEWKMEPAISQKNYFSTLEPCDEFKDAFPVVVEEFNMKNKKPTKKGPKKNVQKAKTKSGKDKCNCDGHVEKQKHMCFFLNKKESCKSDDKAEDKISNLSIEVVTKSLENLDLQNADTSSSEKDNIAEMDDEIDPSELSAIVKDIIGISSTPVRDHTKNTLDGFLSLEFNNLELDSESSDEEFSELHIPLYLRAKGRLNKLRDFSISDTPSNREMLDNQNESACSAVSKDINKLNDDRSLTSVNTPQNLNCGGHQFNPNFSLGITTLLQSPCSDETVCENNEA